jgi:hypothetical protein
MTPRTFHEQLGSLLELRTNLRAAAADLFSREFSSSTGHVATILSGCLFAPSLLTFWFVNGFIDSANSVVYSASGSASSDDSLIRADLRIARFGRHRFPLR